jgi:AraC-like DNA-binding protein
MIRMARSATLSGYPDLARSLGLNPDRMLARVGLSRTSLDDPDRMIPVGSACRLLEESAAAAGVDDFGLRMCETRGVGILGPLGLVIREEATLRDALASLVRYVSLHSEAWQLSVEPVDDMVLIRGALVGEPSAITRQATEMAMGATFRILRELLGLGWRARRVRFVHGAPASPVRHRRHFGVAVEFGAECNAIVCAASDLDTVPPAANAQTVRYARAYVASLLARASPTASDQVGRLVRSLLSTGRCSIDRVATQLDVDRRTIHRRLAAEGTTYSDLVDAIRAELAEQYLGQSQRPVADVAELLGFSLSSAFAHWFSRRFGCSPSAWREKHTAGSRRAPATQAGAHGATRPRPAVVRGG